MFKLGILIPSLKNASRVTDHTRIEKIGDDSILFLWSSKSSGKPLKQFGDSIGEIEGQAT